MSLEEILAGSYSRREKVKKIFALLEQKIEEVESEAQACFAKKDLEGGLAWMRRGDEEKAELLKALKELNKDDLE